MINILITTPQPHISLSKASSPPPPPLQPHRPPISSNSHFPSTAYTHSRPRRPLVPFLHPGPYRRNPNWAVCTISDSARERAGGCFADAIAGLTVCGGRMGRAGIAGPGSRIGSLLVRGRKRRGRGRRGGSLLRRSGMCGTLCGGGGGGRRAIWDLYKAFSKHCGLSLWMCFGRTRWVGQRRRTLRVELQNVDVAVGVRDGYVELFVRREEGGCYHFDCMGGFAEEPELVGVVLCPIRSSSLLSVTIVDEGIGEECRTEYPQNQTPFTASPIKHNPVPSSSLTTLT